MLIKCPNCEFTRQVNENAIPASSSFATCPKCATRFRFRADAPASELYTQTTPVHNEPSTDFNEQPSQAASTQHEQNNLNSSNPQQPQNNIQEPEEISAQNAAPNEPEDIWGRMEKMNERWEKDENSSTPTPPPFRTPDNSYFGQGADNKNGQDFKTDANRAYQRAAGAGRIPLLSPGGSVPWEVKGGFLQPKGLIATVVLILKEMRRFFAGINPFSSILPAWLFALLCYVPQLVHSLSMAEVMFKAFTGESSFTLDASGYVSLAVTMVFMLSFFMFAGSFFVFFMLRFVAPHKANFRLTFKAIAYAQLPMLLAILPGTFGSLFSAAMRGVLFVMAIHFAFRLKKQETALAVTPCFIFAFIILLQSFKMIMGGM